ncbi:MAG: universal stress protein [Burkholderiales bacterium]
MYKHILLPTDGSELAKRAIESGVRLAKSVGARVTGLHVIAKLGSSSLERWAFGEAKSRVRMEAILAEQAEKYIAMIESAAKKAGVRCECICVTGGAPYEEIIKAATSRGCDLIYMASHGKRGESALLLGSETAKVLAHSPIPVLVHRERRTAPLAARARAA